MTMTLRIQKYNMIGTTSCLSMLPAELHEEIVGALPLETLLALMCTSRYWYNFLQDRQHIWRRVYHSKFRCCAQERAILTELVARQHGYAKPVDGMPSFKHADWKVLLKQRCLLEFATTTQERHFVFKGSYDINVLRMCSRGLLIETEEPEGYSYHLAEIFTGRTFHLKHSVESTWTINDHYIVDVEEAWVSRDRFGAIFVDDIRDDASHATAADTEPSLDAQTSAAANSPTGWVTYITSRSWDRPEECRRWCTKGNISQRDIQLHGRWLCWTETKSQQMRRVVVVDMSAGADTAPVLVHTGLFASAYFMHDWSDGLDGESWEHPRLILVEREASDGADSEMLQWSSYQLPKQRNNRAVLEKYGTVPCFGAAQLKRITLAQTEAQHDHIEITCQRYDTASHHVITLHSASGAIYTLGRWSKVGKNNPHQLRKHRRQLSGVSLLEVQQLSDNGIYVCEPAIYHPVGMSLTVHDHIC